MAYEENLKTLTLVAAADLSAQQYRFVNLDGTGKAALAGAGAEAVGVLQNKPVANAEATVADIGGGGTSKVVAGAAIAAGARVASDASGRAVTAGVGNAILGRARVAAAAAGEIIPVLLFHNGAA